MKLKSFLIILVFAITITSATYFWPFSPTSRDVSVIHRGLLIPYWNNSSGEPRFSAPAFMIDILIWVLFIEGIMLITTGSKKVIKGKKH